MRRRLLLGFVLFAFLATSLLIVPLGITLETHESATTIATLKRDTSALSALLSDALSHNELARAIRLADTYAKQTGRQVLVVNDAVALIATTPSQAHDAALIHVAGLALTHELSGQTPGGSHDGPQFYVAVAIHRGADASRHISHPVLIVTFAVNVNNSQIHHNWTELILYGLAMFAIAFLLALLVSGSMVRPLRRIGVAVEAIGAGELNARVPVDSGPDELRRLAVVINATSDRLITLLEAQRAFVEDASHQLRTPLTALQLHLENLQHGSSPDSRDDFASVLSEVARLNRLVDSLLALARLESASPQFVYVDVRDVVVERAEIWRALADENALTLEIDVASGIKVSLIPDALEQILDNLLSNAFDATPRGGTIRVVVRASRESVLLHVVDSGRGLRADERDFALRRFWRGSDNANDGTGLGLSIVDQLVRLSGGSVALHEATPRGIDVLVTLPNVATNPNS